MSGAPASSGGPPSVGIVGAGQLARMLYQAAIALGIDVWVLAGALDESAARVARAGLCGLPGDGQRMAELASACDVLTFDHELVAVDVLQDLASAGVAIRPSPATVAIAQHKGRQRALFTSLGLPVPPHVPVSSVAEVVSFAAVHGWPVVAKAERGGYDGRGVWVLDGPEAAQQLVADASHRLLRLLVEAFVPIERELALLLARRPAGEMVVYPLVETVQRDGICHEVLVPAPGGAALAAEAEGIGRAVAEAVNVSGILAVELFESGGRLLINEIATRPHNSGHFSIESCVTSQFENHLRAVLDWPLGSTELVAPAAAMVNVIATEQTPTELTRFLPAALAVPGAHVHLYGKAARPGRKVGHVTVVGTDVAEARTRAARAAAILRGDSQEDEA